MTPTASAFEDRLLDALLDRFDTVAPRPAAILESVPRQPRIRRYAVPVGCLAAAATAASVMLELGGSAPARHVPSTPVYALAAWTAQPTSASRAQVSAAETYCSASFAQAGASQPAAVQKWPPPQAGGPWSPMLVDTRADLTLTLYSDGTHWISCLEGPSFVSITSIDAPGEPSVTDSSASLDKVSIRQVSGAVYTVAVGRIGSAVTGVGLRRTDGSVVTATVGHGRFIAWWPQGDGVTALSVTTNAGTQSHPVDQRFSRSDPQPTNKAVRQSSGQANNKS